MNPQKHFKAKSQWIRKFIRICYLVLKNLSARIRVKKYGHNDDSFHSSFESIDTLLETPKPHFAVHMDIIKTSLKIPKDVEIPFFLFFEKGV